MKLRQGIMAVMACAALAFTALPATADRYDVPDVLVAEVSRVSVTLDVRAGATGTPGGFAVQFIKSADLSFAGSWDNALSMGLVKIAEFVGTPTYNTLETAPSYRLSPYSGHSAEVGDLFDETGVVSSDFTLELDPATEYQFRACALGDGGGESSLYSTACRGGTLNQPQNCTYTQGYWKNHRSAWPVSSLKLGNTTYSKAQLLSILNTPAQGNGLIILSHQLIAAKLNIAQGADPTPVSAIVADADAMIGNKVCPPIGSGFLDPSATDTDSQALDSYNNGDTYVPHCGTTPAQHSTWGAVKTLYR